MAEYNHTQSISSTTWSITHNLNMSETVNDVFIDSGGNLTKIIPSSVVHTNNNTLTLTFSNQQTGYVRIIG